jgi:hypothetical protein
MNSVLAEAIRPTVKDDGESVKVWLEDGIPCQSGSTKKDVRE